MVNALVSGSSGLGSIPGRGHCVVFLGKTLNSHSASLHPSSQMSAGEFTTGGSPSLDLYPIQGGGEEILLVAHTTETGISSVHVSRLQTRPYLFHNLFSAFLP